MKGLLEEVQFRVNQPDIPVNDTFRECMGVVYASQNAKSPKILREF